MTDHYTNKMNRKGKAEEDLYFARKDRELIEKIQKQEDDTSSSPDSDSASPTATDNPPSPG